jgi:hypothetical protein
MFGLHTAARPVAAGCLAIALALGALPQVATAAGTTISAPLPTRPATVEIAAASGNSILAAFGDDYRLSNDAGKTWVAAKLPLDRCGSDEDCTFEIGRVESGVVPVWRSGDENQVGWFSLLANKPVGIIGEDASVHQAAGSYAVLDDGDRDTVMKSDGTSWSVDAEARDVFADGSVLVESSAGLTRVTAGGATSTLVPGFDSDHHEYEVAGNLLAYTIGSQLCVRGFGSAAHCVGLRGSDRSMQLLTSAGVLGDGDDDGVNYWYPLVAGVVTTGVKVAVAETVAYDFADSQDDQTPLVSTADPTSSRLLRVKSDGSLQQLATVAFTQRAESRSLALTPTSLVGVRRAGGYVDRTWARSVGSTIGTEKTLFDSSASAVSSAGRWATASAVASAGRWAASTASGVVRLFDADGARSTSLAAPKESRVRAISGPNLLASVVDGEDTTYQVWNPGAGWQKDDQALGLFGSLVLDSTAKPNAVTVRDTAGAKASTTVTLPGGATDCYTGYRIWGDWVAADHYVSDPEESDGCDGGTIDKVVAKNFRTGGSTSRGGSLLALGDGVAVLSDDEDETTFSIWNLNTGASTQLSGASDWNADFAIDGARVAYTTATELLVRTIDGVATSAPRNLGVVADTSFNPTKAPWLVDIDLTKPVKAGTLEVRNASGSLVRSVAVPASANGSLRGVAWDGKDSAGKAVPSGNYTYRLVSAAADGSGPARAVDGTDRALGTVTVAYALVPATPQISGRAVFGKKLTVKAGTWKPSKVKLSYQWLRDGQPIAKATKSSYKLGAKDVGRSLSVRVTGKKSGYSAVSATSAVVTVVPASFSKVYAPSISGKAIGGKTVKAKVKSWSPKATFTYQWLRDGQPITGATKATYKIGTLDAGRTITVQVTGRRTGYATVVKLSATVTVA